MKLLSFRRPDGAASWGILKDEGVIDLGSRAPGLKHALWATTSLAEEAARHADFKLADVTLLPPIPDPDKILCIGLNYVTPHQGRRARPAAEAHRLHPLPELPGRPRPGDGAAERVRRHSTMRANWR